MARKAAKWPKIKKDLAIIFEAAKYATIKTLKVAVFIVASGITAGFAQAGERIHVSLKTITDIVDYGLQLAREAGYNVKDLSENEKVVAFVIANLLWVWLIKFYVKYYELIKRNYRKSFIYWLYHRVFP